MRARCDTRRKRIEHSLDVTIGTVSLPRSQYTLVTVYREILDDTVFNRMNAVFVAYALPLLNNEFFFRQGPGATDVPCATLDPGKSGFRMMIPVVAGAVAQSGLDDKTSRKRFAQSDAQIANID